MTTRNASLGSGAHGCSNNQQCPCADSASGLVPLFYLSSFLLLILILSATMPLASAEVLRLSDARIIPFEQMVEDVKNVDVVFVGEYHNDPKSHAAQLKLIKALARRGIPLVIGLEMFRASTQVELDAWIKGTLTLERFQQVYRDNWNFPWFLYQDILLYAREERIPLVGLNVSREVTQKVAREGFGSLTPEDLKQLPPGISCSVDDTYRNFIRNAYRAHGFGSEKSFNNFCEAQMVWDSSMAWHLVEYLRKNPGRVAVVLAGEGHAWKRGTPEQAKKYSTMSYRVVLPGPASGRDVMTLTIQDADYILRD